LDFVSLSVRLDEELAALQAEKSLAVSDFIRPTADRSTPYNYRDPSPARSEPEQGLTATHEGYLKFADEVILQQGPPLMTPMEPYSSSQEDPTPESIQSPESRAVKEKIYQALSHRDAEVQQQQREIEVQQHSVKSKSSNSSSKSKLPVTENVVLRESEKQALEQADRLRARENELLQQKAKDALEAKRDNSWKNGKLRRNNSRCIRQFCNRKSRRPRK
jgi:hypothetical protein